VKTDVVCADKQNKNIQKMKIPFINTHYSNWTSRAVLILLGAVALVVNTPSARAQNAPVFRPDAQPFGISYGEWLAEWWQWSFSFPVSADPENATADFSANQSGPVWFLPAPLGSGTAVRSGVVPHGKALFTPVLTFEVDDAGSPFTSDELTEYVEAGWGYVTEISCTVDGVPVRHMHDPQTTPYVCVTPPFSYTLALQDNVVANYPGFGSDTAIADGTTVDTAVAGGVVVMIKPLPVGNHTIHITGQLAPMGIDYDVTYQITVVPRWHEDGFDTDTE